MTRRCTTSVLMVTILLAGAVPAALGQSAEALDETVRIEVSVECASSPERVTITNNTAKLLRLRSVGSTYRKRAGEPYKLKNTLKPGKSASYSFGTGKGKGKRLSGSFIFDNEAPKEGVAVKTDKGNVKVRCAAGTNAPLEPASAEPVETPEPPAMGEQVDVLELLETVPVEPETEDGYERELFEHWVDADGDGCDTRQEVLIAESLTPVTVGAGCSIEDGSWFSAADGDTLTNPASVDINHVVPLKEAWASGASAWAPQQREAFANDLTDERTLQAVSSGANRQQGENDPASWLPAALEPACEFVTDWVAIKASWGLSVDQAERDAIALTLESCPARTVAFVPRDPAAASRTAG